MACARIDGCPLFKAFSMKSSLKIWQSYFCEGDFTRCQRYLRAAAGETVPANLLPNGRSLAVPLDQLDAKHMQ
jgi:hypothetical protein